MSSTIICLADNLDYLKLEEEGKFDVIYIDPPFNSKRDYNFIFKKTEATEKAFIDTWSNVGYTEELKELNDVNPNLYSFLKTLENLKIKTSYLSFLTNIGIRCFYMHKTLKETGSFFIHCDQKMEHYLKIVLDNIFGEENFRNQIIWCYKRWTAGDDLPHVHDTILKYSKSNKYKINQLLIPNTKPNQSQYVSAKDENGKTIVKRDEKGKPIKRNVSDMIAEGDWWQIPIISPNAKERLGYPTQKPEALLEKIIKMSSDEGDMIGDFYLGGGTTAAVSYKLNRNFLGTDINFRAIQITKERLEKLGAVLKNDLLIYGIPNYAKELKELIDDNIVGTSKNSKFELEDVVIRYYLKNVVGNDKKVNDNSIDGYFGFTYKGSPKKGIVQVTTGSNKNHLKAFCSEVGKGTGDIGVYITFAENVTDGFVKEVKSYGTFGNVDKIQILTLEELIDERKQFKIPF